MVTLGRRGEITSRPPLQKCGGRSFDVNNRAVAMSNKLAIVDPKRSPIIENKKGKILEHLRDYNELVAISECFGFYSM
ncbi:hypothetical protein J1N35_010317 [Gossypium stocksii]|uniref:Uncharacterized protein n=1 Tax=Gossypium stocksii TaxID=47602 RepID=A0A9D3W061_9ROSI|nr:hypothetical protein J1N35_010317 [Gossypium stocksii]